MQTQTLEPTAKWQVVRAEWVRKLLAGKTPEKAEDYASWFTRCQGLKEGFDVPSTWGKPECGYYAVLGKNKVRWFTCCYQRDEKGTIVCYVNGELRHPDNVKLEDWEKLWADAVKKPLEYADYKHLKDTGRLPGESEAAAADRGNVVSINAGNGATLVPAAPRSDGSAVTTTHNQPPEAIDDNTFEGLMRSFELLKISAESRIKKGAAKTKEEADQATDDAERLLKISKKAEELYKAEYEPLDQTVKALRARWATLRTQPDELKKRLKAVVVTAWMKAEDDRRKAEHAAQVAAGASPDELIPPATVRTGSGLGRQTSLRTTWQGKITDRDAFLAHVKNQEAINEALQKIADVYAKSKIEPVPPGLEYEEVSAAV